MSVRTTFRLAWIFWIVSGMFSLTALYFQTANDSTRLLSHLFGALVNLSFATVGALIVARRPQNRVGWLLLVGALIILLGDAMLEYGVYVLITRPHVLPAGDWMAWYGFGVRGVAFIAIAEFLPLLFPDGRLPSRGWHWVAWLALCSVLLFSLSALIGESSGDFRLPFLRNPLGVALPPGISGLLDGANLVVLLTAEAACVAAAVVRFRLANVEERQQLKWFAYAAILAIVALIAIFIGNFLLPDVEEQITLGTILFNLMGAGFPVAVGIAVLKYHLYDIDLIIRRTLIYGVLTASLALVYFGSVVLLQPLSRALTGQQQSELVTVISTLAIAALFNPLRRTVQGFIDRRFYRRKYDAAETLERFSAAVRDEVELDELREHLLGVVKETLQPAHVSLWLKRGRRN